jgi:hypothetical protein
MRLRAIKAGCTCALRLTQTKSMGGSMVTEVTEVANMP